MAEVIDLSTSDVERGAYCVRYRQQKLKRRWTHAACGSPAVIRILFARDEPRKMVRNSDGSLDYADLASYPVCKDCFVKITQELVATLAFL